MAETSYPFDAGAGANVREDQWRQMAKNWLATGVLPLLNQLEVYADSSGMQVKVRTGPAWVEGQFYLNDAEKVVPIGTADASARVDRIVVRADFVANTITVQPLQGTPGQGVPPLTQNTGVWEIPLAQVAVGAGVTTIAAAAVTDERKIVKNLTEKDAIAAYVAKTAVKSSTVDTSESSTQTSFVDLFTIGPVIPVAVNASGILVVTVSCEMTNNTAGSTCYMGFTLSGTGVLAAAPVRSLTYTVPATGGHVLQASREVVLTGLTPGDYTVTSKYQVSGGTGTFRHRQLTVDPR